MTASAPEPGDWRHPDVVVGPSAIAGRGLFAGSLFAAGTAVARVGPGGSPNHFGNHSCDPNLGWHGLELITMRVVVAGEELTCDYSTSTADPEFMLRCHCETYRCRQMVTGDDWRIPQLRARYQAWWGPQVLNLIAQDEERTGRRAGHDAPDGS